MVEMSLNGNKWYRNSYKCFAILFIAHHIYDKTHYQKGLSLRVPYFVKEVKFGQKCINLLQQNAYN